MAPLAPQLETFRLLGNGLLAALAALVTLASICDTAALTRAGSRWSRTGTFLSLGAGAVFLLGFLLICWLHFEIHEAFSLELPGNLAAWVNEQLAAMSRRAAYGLPLYDAAKAPRYVIPVWIENEKYFFWFLCYAIMAFAARLRRPEPRFRAALQLLMAVQVAVLLVTANPFSSPLPRFFAEIGPWLQETLPPAARLELFMRLYPKMIFYYNAHYMWLHPPLLFLAYAALTLTFVTSSFMLVKREPALEALGYSYAKLGYFVLTLGMLLGYPWALQAWGPSWWWDPKVCSSLMMWAVFTTYLHTRLYANKTGMWYFSSILGILCFLAMIFTFLASFFFPGEHTFQ